jgi:pSer/pThr/pTyr-binding forkhead associated (FHA) protein
MKIRLHIAIAAPNERVREFDLEFAGPQILVGRDHESDIQIPLSDVSRKHAQIVRDGDGWVIEDLASGSGTRVNGHALDPHVKYLLSDADVIEIAHATITAFVVNEDWHESSSEDKTSIVAQKMVRDILDSPEKSAPHLLVMNGKCEGMKAFVSSQAQEFIIGRAENLDLSIDDPSLSRRHARIKREWNDLLIEDLGSKNGVVVNGRKIATLTRIKDGDEIFLGTLHLSFSDPTANIIEELEEIATPQAVAEEPEVEIAESDPVYDEPSFTTPSPEVSFMSGLGVTEVMLGLLACGLFAGLVVAFNMWLGG